MKAESGGDAICLKGMPGGALILASATPVALGDTQELVDEHVEQGQESRQERAEGDHAPGEIRF